MCLCYFIILHVVETNLAFCLFTMNSINYTKQDLFIYYNKLFLLVIWLKCTVYASFIYNLASKWQKWEKSIKLSTSFVLVIYCKTLIYSRDLIFARSSAKIYSRDFIFAIHHIFFYNPNNRNYWRGLYFRVPMLSWIYAKIKSSRIKSVLQYI